MKISSEKRIYRYTEQGVISGVCAGVAKYLDIDAVWVRGAAIVGLVMLPTLVVLAYLAAVFLLPRWG